jgi:hypothetical protein
MSERYSLKSLPGVAFDLYQGLNGSWHANVLVSASVPREALPSQGNRPLIDSGTGRWWYDHSASKTVYGRGSHHAGRTLEDAKVECIQWVIDTLNDIDRHQRQAKIMRKVTKRLADTPNHPRVQEN